jgi:hypothetical protein
MKNIHSRSILFLGALTTAFAIFNSCTKKEDDAAQTNIASEVVANLSAISSNYSPTSLAANSFEGVHVQSDPCQGVSDFATCQSNLIREYNKIGKSVVESISSIANEIGAALGGLSDGSSGTSTDGKISWNKTSSTVWSVLARGTSNQSQSYISINGSTYTLKINQAVDVTSPKNQEIEAVINFTNSNTWTVDVFFSNLECDAADPNAPNKFKLNLSFDGTLWTGKAMLYSGRWKAPGATVTCATGYGTADIAMYTDYVGNDTSTKASLYLIPPATGSLAAIGNFDLNDFCTNFAGSCGGGGQPTGGYLAAYPNPFCTTGPGTAPTWNNLCTTNAPVNAASYSNANLWVLPNALKVQSVTMPTNL